MNEEQKIYARKLLNEAVKSGILIRPEICSKCKNESPRGSDGRSTIHGHHYKGYDYPLEVEWLCIKCHFQYDLRKSRENNGRSKLSEKDVEEIRRLRKDTCISMRQLAKDFGVHNTTISRIISEEIWVDAALKEE